MIERIKSALERCGISRWRINERVEETAELFFVKQQLDTRRTKDVHKYEVTVFRDVEAGEGDKPGRGFTSVQLVSSMDETQLEDELRKAYYAAQFAANPYFEMPDPVKAPMVEKTGELAEAPLAQSAGKMARALFAADTLADALVNSAEVFVVRSTDRIVSSEGTDVAYTDAKVKGEFVVQCREPEDVEMFHEFEYDGLDEQALAAKVAEALTFVRDRARAQKTLKSGKYNLVLSGDQVAEVLSYYKERSAASMVYAKYSTWQQGEDVQGETDGERLNLKLAAAEPYSAEGIPMADLSLLEGGKLLTWHGPNRFCRYLGVKPTGYYEKVACGNGTLPFEELKKAPCLWAVAFSDFQMDQMSGHFGGEIRLAYLIEADGTVTPVTGGSVNGSILEAQRSLVFSQERYLTAAYDGPYAVRLKDVSVAGAGE
ncbi:MAG: hypothetical protein HFF19_05750 [Oscillospiraceae bacterium]|jgi:predicted Zn-dependent protease|nr:hypothetical protein [Oscillospiraceae bacterium]